MRCTIFVMVFLPCERWGHGFVLVVRESENKVKNSKVAILLCFLIKCYFIDGMVHEGKVLLENIGRKIKMIVIFEFFLYLFVVS